MRTTTREARSRKPSSKASGKTDTDLFRPEESLGYRLKLTLQAWTRHLDAALRPLGVTHLQAFALAVIELLCEEGETPSQVRVAGFMQLDAMMISKILRVLEERGYIRRSPHPDDPRANALYATAAGNALVRATSPVVRAAHAEFFDRRLDAHEKQTLTALLDRLLTPATSTN